MRTTKHNGRTGRGGAVYNPRHNDRTAVRADKTDLHINDDFRSLNLFVTCYRGLKLTFEEAERRFYRTQYGRAIEARNARYEAQRHPEKIRTIDDIRTDPKTAPEETILQIGDRDTLAAIAERTGERQAREIMRSVLISAVNSYTAYMRRYGANVHVLDIAIHADEASIHAHLRTVYDYVNERGERVPGQKKALECCGILPPHPDEKEGRYNSRKMTFDRMNREEWLHEVRDSIEAYRQKHPDLRKALEPLRDPEKEPEANRKALEKRDYIASRQHDRIREQAEKLDGLRTQIDRAERQIEYIDAFHEMVAEAEAEVDAEQDPEPERHRGRDWDLER